MPAPTPETTYTVTAVKDGPIAIGPNASIGVGSKLKVTSVNGDTIMLEASKMEESRGDIPTTTVLKMAQWDTLEVEPETTGARRRRGKKTRARLSRKSRRRMTRRRR